MDKNNIYRENENLRKEKTQTVYERVKNFDHHEYNKKLLEVLNG